MLDKEIEKKIKKYNKIRSQADDLQNEIENYLDENFGINEIDGFFTVSGHENPYSIDGTIPMYEWGTRYFDLKLIKKIIKFIEKFTKEVGERPDLEEIVDHFKDREDK